MLAALHGAPVDPSPLEICAVVEVAVVADGVEAHDEEIGVLFHEVVIGPFGDDCFGHAFSNFFFTPAFPLPMREDEDPVLRPTEEWSTLRRVERETGSMSCIEAS